ncbi:MAG: glycoside hydrolase family 127 protein [Bryobacterales bacterium]|nr:glycoside hydrolase family 127 protein [Bryobacterales bacterium]
MLRRLVWIPCWWLCVCLSAISLPGQQVSVLRLEESPHAKLRPVPVGAFTITGGLWAARREVNVRASIPSLLDELESHGILDNFRRLSGRKPVARRGPLYTDSDVYKWIEGAAFALQSKPDTVLKAKVDAVIDDIVAAQEKSGYLNTWYQDGREALRWQQQHTGHELYCLGHLLQAALAYQRATGDRVLLDAGIRFVNHILNDVIPGGQALYAGHPEIEMALVELYRAERDKRYLDLASRILTGEHERLKLTESQMRYTFSGKPFTGRTEMEGHAVRACYASAGAADYYLETGDPVYWQTLTRLWDDMVLRKMYVTGGVGSRASGEAFGEPFELPNAQAYTESCAAIANMIWSWRMLHADPQAKYADVIERALYNSINSGMSLSGTLYCYRNPLALSGNPKDKIRNPWYDTTCCPPNLQRVFASLPAYFYSTSAEGLYVHHYASGVLDWKLQDGTRLNVRQTTEYPWQGKVTLDVAPAAATEFAVFLRIPEWSQGTVVRVNGEAQTNVRPGSYLALRRTWKQGDQVVAEFDMTPRALRANPLARENAGSVAIQRGPLMYALEQPDQPLGTRVEDVAFSISGDPAKDFVAHFDSGLLGGVTVLRHRGIAFDRPAAELPLYGPIEAYPPRNAKPVDLTLIPYFTFHNRGEVAMQVWVPAQTKSR